MDFQQYPKIRRLGTAETAGILEGDVYVQEKIDGANASIWFSNDAIQIGSRRRHLPPDESFRGFREWQQERSSTLVDLFTQHPTARLYGEWLVPHTIRYDDSAYSKFYLFDVVFDGETWLDLPAVNAFAQTWSFDVPEYHGRFTNPTPEQLEEFVGKSVLGKSGEGVVLKNPNFINQFGAHQYAKIVTESFKESNAVNFGGNNKHSDSYWEIYVMNKWMTLPRVKKVVQKLNATIEGGVGIEHTGRVINTAYHDLLEEEIWAIQKKVGTLNFKTLAKVCQRKAARLFHDLLAGFNSVVYE